MSLDFAHANSQYYTPREALLHENTSKLAFAFVGTIDANIVKPHKNVLGLYMQNG